MLEYKRAYYRKNSEKYRELELQTKYGITLQEYNARLKEQSGSCKICKKPERVVKGAIRSPKLSVDHCHKTGKVRALLCRKCNTAIGSFEDDTQLLKAAIAYLESHSST